ncbi:hypothetical protein D3C71_1167790 [compost metagenome]
MLFKVKRKRLEIGKSALRSNKPQLHQLSGRIVDEDQQRARRATVLKPAVLGAVDLHQFTISLAPQPRLMKRPPLFSRKPDASILHPLTQRLTRDCDAMLFLKLLGRQRWPEIKVAFAHQNQNIITDAGGYFIV